MSIVQEFKERRSKLAARLLEIRALCLENGVKRRLRLMLMRETLGKERPPIKPTRENLFQLALSELRFSRSRWSNPYDTEWYSACGYDDMQAEARSEAEKFALELYGEWKAMGAAAANG